MSVMHQKMLLNIMYACTSSGKISSKTEKVIPTY